jgi:hypothetical protein
MLLILLALTRAYEIIARHERISQDFLVQNQVEFNMNPQKKLEANQDAFFFDFQCGNSSFCESAQNGLISAGKRIAEELFIVTQIRVNASFQDLGAGLLGTASSTNDYEITHLNKTFLYPQSLVKQLNIASIQFSNFDIWTSINSNQNWYFKDQRTPMTPDQFDFEFIVIHELLHGLGFKSNLMYSGSLRRLRFTNTRADYLVPPASYNPTTREMSFAKSSPYDALINNGNSTFEALQDQLSFKFRTNDYATFFRQFEASLQLAAAEQMYSVATSDGVFITLPSNQSVLLHTTENFTQGTSLSHVAFEYTTLPDFVMIPSGIPGFYLDYLIRGSQGTSVLGPRILSILQVIGWEIKVSIQ